MDIPYVKVGPFKISIRSHVRSHLRKAIYKQQKKMQSAIKKFLGAAALSSVFKKYGFLFADYVMIFGYVICALAFVGEIIRDYRKSKAYENP